VRLGLRSQRRAEFQGGACLAALPARRVNQELGHWAPQDVDLESRKIGHVEVNPVDIEALVARITEEVMHELRGANTPASVPATAPSPPQWTPAPPPALTPASVSAGSCAGCGQGCPAQLTGECLGLGHCATLIPQKVQAVIEAGADRVGSGLGNRITGREVGAMIDHTLLKPEATREEVLHLCEEARAHSFASVCVNPAWVRTAAEALRGSGVKVCTVVGFPLGATTTITKVMETRDAVANGADEIDMVINIGALKNGQDDLVESDIREVVLSAGGRLVKTILETALLSDDEVVRACHLARRAGVDFVKTSTGFGPGGATAHHVALMRRTVGRNIGVKASGGIRDFETAQKMIEAGATRIGASASVKIVKGESAGAGTY